jgi:hypothetical protein
MSETIDYWDTLDRSLVADLLVKSGLSEEDSEKSISVFIDILNKVEDAESLHIKSNLISTNDIRSAALCFEAMCAFNLLKNKIGDKVES